MRALHQAAPASTGDHMFSLNRIIGAEDGQDLLEYAVLAALIAIAAVGAVGLVGNKIYEVLWQNIGASI
jgi:Flp pilus assembly pilin Flp